MYASQVTLPTRHETSRGPQTQQRVLGQKGRVIDMTGTPKISSPYWSCKQPYRKWNSFAAGDWNSLWCPHIYCHTSFAKARNAWALVFVFSSYFSSSMYTEYPMTLLFVVFCCGTWQVTSANYTRELDSDSFWARLAEHFFVGAVFAWISRGYFHRTKFRVDLMEAHLMKVRGEEMGIGYFHDKGKPSVTLAHSRRTQQHLERLTIVCRVVFTKDHVILGP